MLKLMVTCRAFVRRRVTNVMLTSVACVISVNDNQRMGPHAPSFIHNNITVLQPPKVRLNYTPSIIASIIHCQCIRIHSSHPAIYPHKYLHQYFQGWSDGLPLHGYARGYSQRNCCRFVKGLPPFRKNKERASLTLGRLGLYK